MVFGVGPVRSAPVAQTVLAAHIINKESPASRSLPYCCYVHLRNSLCGITAATHTTYV